MLSKSVFCSVGFRKSLLTKRCSIASNSTTSCFVPYHVRNYSNSSQDGPARKQSEVKAQHVNDLEDKFSPVEGWTVTDVENWAKSIVGDKAAKILVDEEINGKSLLTLSQEELERCGMKLGPAKEIIAALKKLEPEITAWQDPHPLLSTSGMNWPFQHEDIIRAEIIRGDIPLHYQSWKYEKFDKQLHPLYVIAGGPGTGKSRLCQEFPRIVKEIYTNGDLGKRLNGKETFTFNISFENGTGYDSVKDKFPDIAIGNRMMYQLLGLEGAWDKFSANSTYHPSDVFTALAKFLSKSERNLTIFLVVDGIQCFPHTSITQLDDDSISTNTPLYDLLRLLSSHVNQSKPFIIACCSCTLRVPLREFIRYSPQNRVFLPVSSLDGFQIFNPKSDSGRQLIYDMGGYGRALEILNDFNELEDYSKIMNEVVFALKTKYPSWFDNPGYFVPLLRVVLSGYPLPDPTTKIPDLPFTVDEICRFGLFEYHQDKQILVCPYIWLIYMAAQSSDKLIRALIFGHFEYINRQVVPNSYHLPKPTWQQWEIFNGLFHCLKSKVFNGQTVSLSHFHSGALLNVNPDSQIQVKELSYVQSAERINTKEVSFSKEILHENGISIVGDCLTYFQNASGASSGDGFHCFEVLNTKNKLLEIHQVKLESNKILRDKDFILERVKSADPISFFIMLSTYSSFKGTLPLNSGLVTSENFEKYYGPFSGRAYYMSRKVLLDINTCTRSKLMSIPNIGRALSKRIIENRPYNDLEECIKKTKICRALLEHDFDWNKDNN